MKKLLEKSYGYIPLLMLGAFYTFQAIHFPIHDFANYYFGGTFLRNGHFNTAVYFPYSFNKNISEMGYHGIFASYTPNTPFLGVLFFPFSFLSIATAKLLWNSISLLLFIVGLYRLVSFYKINPTSVLLVPFLFFVPLKNELLFGQVYLLLFFLLCESLLAYEKKQFPKMAVFLSFAILLKVFPVFLILLFLFKKELKPLGFTMISCLLFGIFSAVFVGTEIWVFYFNTVLPKAFNGEIATAFVANYQSVFMFLKTLFVVDASENPTAVFNFPSLFSALLLAFKIGVLGIGFYLSKSNLNRFVIFSFWMMISLLLSPYGSTYTFILLLFPFLSLAQSEMSTLKKILLGLLLWIITNLPLSYFLENRFPFSYLRLYGFLLFFGILVFQFKKQIRWKVLLFCTIIPLVVVPLFKKSEVQNSTGLLDKNTPILIYDFTIKKDKLTYFYWNENGVNSKAILLKANDWKPLSIKNRQIYLDQKQLTFDASNKRKPILINGNTVLFLSDFNRGIGFYSLRKISLH